MKEPDILGRWVHAHERDDSGAKVFVSAVESLPPSRGRQRLEFLPDGTFVEGQPGADDRTTVASGTYRLDGKRLFLLRANSSEPAVFDAFAGDDGTSLKLKKV
jgi:hypothetical protein